MATPESVQIDQAQTPGARIATLGITRDDQTVEVQEVAVSNPETGDYLKPDASGAMPVSGPLTDTQLRASAVPVSGPLTDAQLRASAVPVSGPLTDTQLRASPVPISGNVAATPAFAQGAIASAADYVELTVDGYASVAISATGNFGGGLTPEYTINGTTWNVLYVASPVSNAAQSAFAGYLSNGYNYQAAVAGFYKIRVRGSGAASGSSQITIRASYAPFAVSAVLGPSSMLAFDVALGVRTYTSNAALRQKIISAASTNAASIKTSAGRVYGYVLANTSASWRYLKLFNKTTTPNLGVDTPTEVIPIPPGGVIEFVNPIGVAHSLGIALAITAVAADLDATAISANDIVGTLIYA
jgi:hypothetical protein